MEDTIALLKAISYIVWPICLLLIIFMFRKEIRTVLLGLINKQSEKIVGENPPETQIPAPPLPGHVDEISQIEDVILQPDATKITSDDQLTVAVCKNISSGKYFVVLEDDDSYEIKTIAPNGNIKNLKREIFHETIKYITVDKLTERQREKVYTWIGNVEPNEGLPVNTNTERIKGYLPSYMRMVNNPNTLPAKMLAYIKSKGSVTWCEVKQYLHNRYHYEPTSGAMGASLKALETLGLVTINGHGDDKIITYVGPEEIKMRKIMDAINKGNGSDKLMDVH